MGRHRDPAAVQAAKGHPRKQAKADRLEVADAVEAVAPRKIDPPHKLNRDERRVWDKLAVELTRMNLVKTTDLEALARYCYQLDRWWKLSRRLKKEGEVYISDSRHGKMQRLHPLFHATMRIDQRLEAYEDRFGLSPSSRQRLLLGLANQLPPGKPGELFENKGEQAPPPDSESPVGLLNAGRSVH